jgi:predicted small lipoprotein YifL
MAFVFPSAIAESRSLPLFLPDADAERRGLTLLTCVLLQALIRSVHLCGQKPHIEMPMNDTSQVLEAAVDAQDDTAKTAHLHMLR